MSILTKSEQCIGIMEHDGFYRAERHGDLYQTPWCCDSFKVKQEIIKVDGKPKLTINVTFKTLTGDVLFDWDLDSLNRLNQHHQLIHVLLNHGVRVSTSPQATIAIIDAIQRPELINTWGMKL